MVKERLPTPEEIAAAAELKRAYKAIGTAQDLLVKKAAVNRALNALDHAVVVTEAVDMKESTRVEPLSRN